MPYLFVPKFTGPSGGLTTESRNRIAADFALSEERLPDYAGQSRPHTYKRPYYNMESPAMAKAREAIARGLYRGEEVTLVCIGDSKTMGQGAGPTNYLDAYPSQLRRSLGGVEGFTKAATSDLDNRWTSSNMIRKGFGLGPDAGTTGLVKSASLAHTEDTTGATVLISSAGGASITFTVDGVQSTVPLSASTGWQTIDTGALAEGRHTIGVESTDDFEIGGINWAYSGPRLRVVRAGRGGATAAQWLPGSGFNYWEAVIDSPVIQPDAIICEIGTNSASDLTSIADLYTALAGTGQPVIAQVPGGLNDTEARTEMRAQIYDSADAHDLPLVDQQAVLGTSDEASEYGLMDDAVHQTPRGYALEALAVADLLA